MVDTLAIRSRPGPVSRWSPTLGLALLLATSTTFAAQEGIRAVTLSSGGMAEIHRTAKVADENVVRLQVPLAQVDDILKTLVVQDPAGAIKGVALDGLSPVDETFERLPFTASDLTSLPALLSTLQGAPVRVTSRGRTVEGTVLGVAMPASQQDTHIPDGDIHEPPTSVLSVMTEPGQIETLSLGADSSLDILDSELRDKVRSAATVSGQGKMENMRELSIFLAGSDEREIALRYAVAAPVWKTAFRLMLGNDDARLQAWAVLENASGDDWQGIDLSLVSGAPVMLSQALHRRYWHQRPEVPVFVGATGPTRIDDAPERKLPRPAPAMEMARGMTAAAFRPSPPPAEATTTEGQTAATYHLPAPIDLPAGKTLTVPYLDVTLPGEQVSLFQPERHSLHPVAGVILTNSTSASLPAGILTVYDTNNHYVGDAQLGGVPPGETRVATFAEDRKVSISSSREADDHINQVSVVDGVLRARRLTRDETTYTVQGASDAPRTIIIEHPKRSGWKLTSSALDGETPTHYRLRVSLAPGETQTLTATAERVESESLALADASADVLMTWSGRAADETTAQQLKSLAQERQTLAQAEQRILEIAGDIERAAANQARIRDNLAAVPAESELGRRYRTMLGQEEDRIVALESQLSEQRIRLEGLRQTLLGTLEEMQG